MKTPRRNISEQIPYDLITEILSRLPAKSVARCRCVSKLWNSMLRLPCFSELFLTTSSSRPQLLFSLQNIDNLLFLSSPQPRNTGGCSLSLVSANYQTKFPVDGYVETSGSVHGLVCVTCLRKTKSEGQMVAVICNPSTVQSLTLPKLRASDAKCFFEYDPIDKQYKILSLTRRGFGASMFSWDHHVLTLGTENPRWRKVECSISHCPLHDGICIYGVLYYIAKEDGYSGEVVIVCFDVRSEKFRLIKGDKDMSLMDVSLLVNYKGKLGALLSPNGRFYGVTRTTRSFEMWILENAEKYEWSKHVYKFPNTFLKNVVRDAVLHFDGVANTNEIVLSTRFLSNPFIVIYYNIERKTIRRDEIQGMDAPNIYRVHTFVNHVENVKSLWMHHNGLQAISNNLKSIVEDVPIPDDTNRTKFYKKFRSKLRTLVPSGKVTIMYFGDQKTLTEELKDDVNYFDMHVRAMRYPLLSFVLHNPNSNVVLVSRNGSRDKELVRVLYNVKCRQEDCFVVFVEPDENIGLPFPDNILYQPGNVSISSLLGAIEPVYLRTSLLFGD